MGLLRSFKRLYELYCDCTIILNLINSNFIFYFTFFVTSKIVCWCVGWVWIMIRLLCTFLNISRKVREIQLLKTDFMMSKLQKIIQFILKNFIFCSATYWQLFCHKIEYFFLYSSRLVLFYFWFCLVTQFSFNFHKVFLLKLSIKFVFLKVCCFLIAIFLLTSCCQLIMTFKIPSYRSKGSCRPGQN